MCDTLDTNGSMFPGDETEEPVNTTQYPSIHTRLANLRPSKDLLDYYRTKIAQYDSEFEVLGQKLDAFKSGYQQQDHLLSQVKMREDEISELQKSISDIQIVLFQEREQVLRLYAENDRLKLRELEDRKKIQHLLSLTGSGDQPGGDITYFHKEPPAKVIIPQYRPNLAHNISSDSAFSEDISLRKAVPSKSKRKDHNDSLNSSISNVPVARSKQSKKVSSKKQSQLPEEQEKDDVEVLRLQIEALQAQMEDQAKLAKEQVEALLEDRRVRIEEMAAQRQRDTQKVQELQENLKKTQEMLYDSTKECLANKAEVRKMEKKWIHEKDRLLRELDEVKEKLSNSQHRKVEILSESVHNLEVNNTSQKDTIQSLQVQLEQSQKLSDMYREQIIALEDEMSKIREEGDIGKELFKERTEKMAKRLQLMNQRYESLEQRRNLEVEGFKNDIKMTRARLRDVEKQLYKVTLSFAQPLIREDKDLELLSDVKQSNTRTKHMLNDLHSLKAKIYGLENDLHKV